MRDFRIEYVLTQLHVIDVKATNEYGAMEELNKLHKQRQPAFGMVTENVILVRVEEMEPLEREELQ